MIVLKGDDSDILSIKLEDILSCINNIDKYAWKLLWLDGVSFKFNIGKLIKNVNNSLDGYIINSNELFELSRLAHQLIEVVLIGDQNGDDLHKLENDDVMKEKYDFFIELVDGSYWEVTAPTEILNTLKLNLE